MIDKLMNASLGSRHNAPQAAPFSLDQLLTGPGGLAAGAAAGGLAGLLLSGGKPKKLAKNALKVGGVALVGGLAYKAWHDWQSNKTPATDASLQTAAAPIAETPFIPDTDKERRALARLLTRAMVTAAKADGHIDTAETQRILSQLKALQVDEADHNFIRRELESPMDVEAIVRGAKTPELAAEIYTASLLAIDPQGEAERGYLAMLAARLKLNQELVAHIHTSAAGPVVRATA